MLVKAIAVGDYQSNAYIVSASKGGEAVLIDPGDEAGRLVKALEGFTVRAIVLTHGHVDHIGAVEEVRRSIGEADFIVGREDVGMIESPVKNLSALMGQFIRLKGATRAVQDGDEIAAGPLVLRVLATPGHTPGGISLYAADDGTGRGAVFTGDTLFAGSIGRTDFPGGDMETLLESIRTKLLTLPQDTVVWPGHGPSTTIGAEKRENPFL